MDAPNNARQARLLRCYLPMLLELGLRRAGAPAEARGKVGRGCLQELVGVGKVPERAAREDWLCAAELACCLHDARGLLSRLETRCPSMLQRIMHSVRMAIMHSVQMPVSPRLAGILHDAQARRWMVCPDRPSGNS